MVQAFVMSTHGRPIASPSQAPVAKLHKAIPEDELHLRDAVAELASGAYVDLTHEQLEHWAATGEFPWTDESLG